jgi:hypothetical protein
MDPLRLHAVAARVVAWHNRHPLACRITAAQVHSVGYVALPYVTPGAAEPAPVVAPAEGPSLRERAAARARQQAEEGIVVEPPPGAPAVAAPPATVRAAFSEDFIAPLKPRQVARWAARHGRVLAQTPANGPLREVVADGLQPGHRPLTLYVLTAAIEVGDRRHRVLLAGGDDPAVLGRRMLSRPRLASWTLAPLGTAAALLLVLRTPLPRPGVGPLMPAAASAPPVLAQAPAASGPAPHLEERGPPAVQLHTVALVATPASAASSAEAATEHSAPRVELPPAPPLDVEPRLGRITLPPLNLPITDEAKAAARQARLERQPAPAVPATPEPEAAPAVAAAASAAAAPVPVALAPQAPAPARGAAFAVSTRPLRTRAEAEQFAAAMGSLLKGQPDLRVEVLPQGDDWRVVGWPFTAAAQADKARALLAARGMRVAVVDF